MSAISARQVAENIRTGVWRMQTPLGRWYGVAWFEGDGYIVTLLAEPVWNTVVIKRGDRPIDATSCQRRIIFRACMSKYGIKPPNERLGGGGLFECIKGLFA